MRMGRCNKWVTLARWPDTEDDTRGTALSPEGAWAAIEPFPPGAADSLRSITHTVSMRYHPQVTLDTRVAYSDGRTNLTRYLYVRGVQTVNEAGDELRLLCEEVQP